MCVIFHVCVILGRLLSGLWSKIPFTAKCQRNPNAQLVNIKPLQNDNFQYMLLFYSNQTANEHNWPKCAQVLYILSHVPLLHRTYLLHIR